ncbi:MAG: prolipoprotein diacylglyceryl transferase [Rhodospirillales bacterium]|nr:prolipoprotein diacylglyceryl transferase [Rhodospirillales bacterium]
MTFAIAYPVIDPILVQIGPFAIRWYALAYLVGLLLGWQFARWRAGQSPHLVEKEAVDDFLTWATLGVVLGGRLGYVLFYKPSYYFEHPLAALQVWHGGMSFHGGLLGVIVAGVSFCAIRHIRTLAFADLIFCAAPIGLFLGRLANFINGELVGRPGDVPWAMVFPGYGPEPRHPSQLYEAGLEGLLLFTILFVLSRFAAVRERPGVLTGAFLVGYGLFRSFGELFREPDSFLGFIAPGLTMGQVLSLPMAMIGAGFVIWALRRPRVCG